MAGYQAEVLTSGWYWVHLFVQTHDPGEDLLEGAVILQGNHPADLVFGQDKGGAIAVQGLLHLDLSPGTVHFHNGSQDAVEASSFSQGVIQGFRDFMDFVEAKMVGGESTTD